jgi:hypothetical protein
VCRWINEFSKQNWGTKSSYYQKRGKERAVCTSNWEYPAEIRPARELQENLLHIVHTSKMIRERKQKGGTHTDNSVRGMACLVILLTGEDETARGNAGTVAAASIASRRCCASEEAGKKERGRGTDLRRGWVGWE